MGMLIPTLRKKQLSKQTSHAVFTTMVSVSGNSVSHAISNDLACDPNTKITFSEDLNSNLSRDSTTITSSNETEELGAIIKLACG